MRYADGKNWLSTSSLPRRYSKNILLGGPARQAAAPKDTVCLPESYEQGLGASLPGLFTCGDDAQLLHQAEVVIAQPALHDLAALESEQLQSAHRDARKCRRNASQVAGMRSVVGPAFGDRINLGQQLINRDMQVRAAGAERAQNLLEAVSVTHVRRSGILMHVGSGMRPSVGARFDGGCHTCGSGGVTACCNGIMRSLVCFCSRVSQLAMKRHVLQEPPAGHRAR